MRTSCSMRTLHSSSKMTSSPLLICILRSDWLECSWRSGIREWNAMSRAGVQFTSPLRPGHDPIVTSRKWIRWKNRALLSLHTHFLQCCSCGSFSTPIGGEPKWQTRNILNDRICYNSELNKTCIEGEKGGQYVYFLRSLMLLLLLILYRWCLIKNKTTSKNNVKYYNLK